MKNSVDPVSWLLMKPADQDLHCFQIFKKGYCCAQCTYKVKYDILKLK